MRNNNYFRLPSIKCLKQQLKLSFYLNSQPNYNKCIIKFEMFMQSFYILSKFFFFIHFFTYELKSSFLLMYFIKNCFTFGHETEQLWNIERLWQEGFRLKSLFTPCWSAKLLHRQIRLGMSDVMTVSICPGRHRFESYWREHIFLS